MEITPSRNWSGDGLLGIVIRLEAFDITKEPVDIDVNFDSIYQDFETQPRERSNSNRDSKQRGSQIFARKSFTNSNNETKSTAMTNYLSHNSMNSEEYFEEDSPSRRGSSSGSRFSKIISPKSSFAGRESLPSTAGNTPSSPDNSFHYNNNNSNRSFSTAETSDRFRVTFSPDSGSNKNTPRRKSSKGSGIFKRFSFTS